MSELTYTSGVTGQVFDLESKLSWGAALGLRSREWDYSLTYRGLGMPTRKAREVSVSMSVINRPIWMRSCVLRTRIFR